MPETRQELRAQGITSATITPGRDEYTGEPEYLVYGHGEYPEGSVLAGEYRRLFLDRFATETEAKSAYPWAEVQGGLLPTSQIVGRSTGCPPADFSPDDAGETW